MEADNDALIISIEEFRLFLKFMPEWNEPTGDGDSTIMDWNTLMPVVEKIEETIPSNIEILKSQTVINVTVFGKSKCFYHDTTSGNKISRTYEAVVEFIKWYNAQIDSTKQP